MQTTIPKGPWRITPHEQYHGCYRIEGPAFAISFWTVATDITAEQAAQRMADAKAITVLPGLLAFADEVRAYLDERADADLEPGDAGHTGNAEMRLLVQLDEA